jgi:hypothetical protein
MTKNVGDAEDATVAVDGDLGAVDLAALVGGGEEILLPILDPLDRSPASWGALTIWLFVS